MEAAHRGAVAGRARAVRAVEDRAHERLRVWTADDTWDQLLDHVVVKDDSVGNVTLVLVGASCRALPSATTLSSFPTTL